MSSFPLIWLEVFLGFGIPLAWGIWELVQLRRSKQRDRERESADTRPDQGA